MGDKMPMKIYPEELLIREILFEIELIFNKSLSNYNFDQYTLDELKEVKQYGLIGYSIEKSMEMALKIKPTLGYLIRKYIISNIL